MLRMFKNTKVQYYLVQCLEANNVLQVLVKKNQDRFETVLRNNWDSRNYLFDKTGKRLFEEIKKRSTEVEIKNEISIKNVLISTPGNVANNKEILRSSRLGIYENINIDSLLSDSNDTSYFIYHDTQCLAIGEAKYGILKKEFNSGDHSKNFAYIYIDEGIGCTLFINGQPYLGNGSAGHIGRMVLDPTGSFNMPFESRGALEVYASRPWVSRNMVCSYLSERNKRGSTYYKESEFRKAIELIADDEEKWSSLPCEIMNKGIKSQDIIAEVTFEEAAKRVGMAINSIILVANPETLILGGKMIWDVENFAEKVIKYSRMFAYANSWNRTNLVLSKMKMEAQILGAIELFIQQNNHE